LLADIHANLPALSAVLDDIPPVEAIVCLGDVVGYYANPNEVCALMRERKIPSVRGNHDAYVLGDLSPNRDRVAAYRTDWTRQVLAADNMAWLRSLPTSLEFRWGKTAVSLRHANPWDEEQYLYPDSELNKIEIARNEFLALGHTHIPMLRPCGAGFVVNPGSVGQPRDCNPRASYAILDCETGIVDFRRTDYDVAALQNRLRRLGWEPTTIAILGRTSRDDGSEQSSQTA
jgi:putative phosphoesterase